jgi:hypothetical protein
MRVGEPRSASIEKREALGLPVPGLMKIRGRQGGCDTERRVPLLPAILVLLFGAAGCDGSTSLRDVCTGVTCSGHGHCVSDGLAPRCACDPEYSPLGLDCVAQGADGDGDGDGDADGDADAPAGLSLGAAGITTLGGAVVQATSLRVTDMGFESGARLCAGSLCVEGGVVP